MLDHLFLRFLCFENGNISERCVNYTINSTVQLLVCHNCYKTQQAAAQIAYLSVISELVTRMWLYCNDVYVNSFSQFLKVDPTLLQRSIYCCHIVKPNNYYVCYAANSAINDLLAGRRPPLSLEKDNDIGWAKLDLGCPRDHGAVEPVYNDHLMGYFSAFVELT